MTLSIYDVASPILVRGLTNLSGFLERPWRRGLTKPP